MTVCTLIVALLTPIRKREETISSSLVGKGLPTYVKMFFFNSICLLVLSISAPFGALGGHKSLQFSAFPNTILAPSPGGRPWPTGVSV
jgi:hypothetical protein